MRVLSRAENLFLAHGEASAPGFPALCVFPPLPQSIQLATSYGGSFVCTCTAVEILLTPSSHLEYTEGVNAYFWFMFGLSVTLIWVFYLLAGNILLARALASPCAG